jgi:hypothetical protein
VIEGGSTTTLALERVQEEVAVCTTEVNGVVVSSRGFVFASVEGLSSVRVAIPEPSWFGRVEVEKRTFSFSTFLPVADVGFAFVVQGDFVVTANPEDVHEGDPHNLFLRSNCSNSVPRLDEPS